MAICRPLETRNFQSLGFCHVPGEHLRESHLQEAPRCHSEKSSRQEEVPARVQEVEVEVEVSLPLPRQGLGVAQWLDAQNLRQSHSRQEPAARVSQQRLGVECLDAQRLGVECLDAQNLRQRHSRQQPAARVSQVHSTFPRQRLGVEWLDAANVRQWHSRQEPAARVSQVHLPLPQQNCLGPDVGAVAAALPRPLAHLRRAWLGNARIPLYRLLRPGACRLGGPPGTAPRCRLRGSRKACTSTG